MGSLYASIHNQIREMYPGAWCKKEKVDRELQV